MIHLSFLLGVSVAIFSTYATSSTNITASTCSSPDEFSTCWGKVTDDTARCLEEAGTDQVMQLACGCTMYLFEMQCAWETCWNQVYSCEYQTIALEYLRSCTAQELPYLPAPDNAGNRCSCNLGHVYYNVTSAFSAPCSTEATTDVDASEACSCCNVAEIETSMFEICPDTDPDSIGWSTEKTLISYWDTNLDDCSALFSSYDCVADLEFTPIGTIPYLTAAPTSTGTQTPYNTGAAITSPISPTITFSQLSGPVFTITASSAKGGTVIAASGTAASATGSGGGSAATGKASSSSSSSSGSSSGAASLSALDSLGLVVVIGVLSLVGIP